jgi:hypothetical protein
MKELIISYLLQCKECILPGIGVLKVINTPASTDHKAKIILPPFQTIVFSNTSHSRSAGLVQYIARIKNISASEAETGLLNFCKQWKEKILSGDKLKLDTLGTLYQNGNELVFEREQIPSWYDPISVEETYQGNREPGMQQDAVPAKVEATENIVTERSYWEIWALILLAVGSVILFYHFRDHSISAASTGNQHSVTVDSAKATYKAK